MHELDDLRRILDSVDLGDMSSKKDAIMIGLTKMLESGIIDVRDISDITDELTAAGVTAESVGEVLGSIEI